VKKPHRPPPYVFSDEEIRRLFRVIDTQPLSDLNPPVQRRHAADVP
jgi:integrase/recombinase XerD